MHKSISLGLLVLANVLAAMLVLFLATCGNYFWPASIFDPGMFALAGIAAAQVLVLAIVTALYDPRIPAARWLAIAAILFCSLTILALESATASSLVEMWRGWHKPSTFLWDVREHLFSTAPAAMMVLAASVALVLVVHIVCWPLRTTFGWRLVRKGDPDAFTNSRQFGITHLLAWVGLSASLLWLLTTAAGGDQLGTAILAVMILAGISLLFVAPWLYLLRKKEVNLWPLAAACGTLAALSYAVQEGIAQFNLYQVANSKSVAAALLLPSFQFQELFGYAGTITLTTFLNLFALRKIGFRFEGATRATSGVASDSSPSHSTTIAPQPSNSMPNVAASS